MLLFYVCCLCIQVHYFVVENNGTAIEATLVNYYNAKSRQGHSYLDIVQTICSEVTKSCPGGIDNFKDKPKVHNIFLCKCRSY